ncbi:hypothetical protein ACFWRV_01720 [Streptomyces sp. NPDC058576]|uniref:hypothetical protein n=1 Tax=Streptomyces sp. NPDC058576 TaxID=3346547 RepID=UPI003664C07C
MASRTRTLAAFAVTVGSDAAVADLMGLNEREVRVARRTVGKEDARIVADQLLKQPAEMSPQRASPAAAPAEPPPQPPAPVPDREEPHADAVRAQVPHQRPEAEAPARQPEAAGTVIPAAAATWTEGMDSVLQWSWESGLDLQTVAGELGLNSKDLLLRAQMLAAEGRLAPKTPAYEDNQSGRHRRHNAVQYTFVPDSPETLYGSPHPYG